VKLWKSVVGKLWMTIIGLVALVLAILGMFLLDYIDETFANSSDVKHLFIITGVIGFSLTTFFAFFLSFRITAPLLQMKKAADRLSQGDYSIRVKYRAQDEIGDLSNAFNIMAEELERTVRVLSQQKEHLDSILRSMYDAVITFDAEGRIIHTNPRGEKLVFAWRDVDWQEDESDRFADGVESESSVPAARRTPGPLRPLVQSCLSGMGEVQTRLHVQNSVYSVVMTPLTAGNGAVAVLRDITEEVKLEKMRKDFLANVSHELRTPLSMLQGYSEALLDGIAGSEEERNELFKVIHDESLRMGRLVNNLLDLARMEAGYFEMRCEPVDLRELCARVLRKFAALCQQENVTLRHDLGEPHADLVIQCGDPDRLEQVLTNLLDNALRHTPAGRAIEIAAEPVQNADGSRWVRIRVRDEGTGIPPEDVPYIFERFYKADKARTRGHNGGTGLGLAIVKNLIDAHRGRIEVDSELGKGTTFSITIPVELTAIEKAKS
jgi:two-component system sensor histidine kinase ResE